MSYPQKRFTTIEETWDSAGRKGRPVTTVETYTSLTEIDPGREVVVGVSTTLTLWSTSDQIQTFSYFQIENKSTTLSLLVELTTSVGTDWAVFTIPAGGLLRIPSNVTYDTQLTGTLGTFTTIKVKNADASSTITLRFEIGR